MDCTTNTSSPRTFSSIFTKVCTVGERLDRAFSQLGANGGGNAFGFMRGEFEPPEKIFTMCLAVE